MKQNIAAPKRLCLIVLALLLVQTAAVSALASEAAGIPACSITITGQDDMPHMVEGQFAAYQIFGGRLVENAPEGEERRISDVTWGSGIDAGGFMEELLADETPLEADGEETDPETVGELFARGLAAGGLAVGDGAEYTEDGYAAQTARVLSDSPYRDNGDLLRQFARLAARHLTENGTASVLADSGDPACRTSVITVDGPGYYLVTENSGADGFVRENNAISQYILEVLGNQTVELKADIPEVTKEILAGDDPIKGLSAGVTDTVWFRITGTLPRNYDAYDTFFYQLTDTISSGFTFVGTSLKLAIDGREVGPYKKETGEYRFRFPITHNPDGSGDTFQLIFDDLNKLKEEGYAITEDSRIVVTYCARVNGKARLVPGEDNRVTLEYSNDPNGNGRGFTTQKAVYVYPLGLDIVKIGSDGEQSTGLEGAKFLLSRQTEPAGGAAETWYGVFGGKDRSTGRQKLVRWTADPGEATVLVTDETGRVSVEGLGAGAYVLTETLAPEGHNTMKPVSFTLTADIDTSGLLTALEMSVNGAREDVIGSGDAGAEDGAIMGDAKTGVFSVTLIDERASILPHTGGRGELLFSGAGALLIAGGAVYARYRRIKKTAVPG